MKDLIELGFDQSIIDAQIVVLGLEKWESETQVRISGTFLGLWAKKQYDKLPGRVQIQINAMVDKFVAQPVAT